MEIKFWTLLFLLISSQGFFLGLLLFLKKQGNKQSNFFLGLFIILFSLIVLFWVGYWNDFAYKYLHFNFLYNPLPLLLGPFFMFYVRSFYKSFSKNQLVHLTPFLLMIVYFFPFYILSGSEKFNLYKYGSFEDVLLGFNFIKGFLPAVSSISLLFYALYCYRLLRMKKKLNILDEISEKILKSSILFYNAVVFFSVVFSLIQIVSKGSWSIYLDYILGILMGVFVYLQGYLRINEGVFIKNLEKSVFNKYIRSGLNPDDVQKFIKIIIDYIETSKPYLKEDYKLQDLSFDTQIPAHHISELLNKYHESNFSELINKYRVEEAKKLLAQRENQLLKVSSIGYDVGFNSRTAFYFWFKKITGYTPAAYQKKIIEF